MEVFSQAEKIYHGLKARVAEHFGFDMNRRPKVGDYVRDPEGRISRVLWWEVAPTHVMVQTDAFGKGRHKRRRKIEWTDLHILNAMEVLAEAAR